MVARLLPVASSLSPRERRALTVAGGVTLALLALTLYVALAEVVGGEPLGLRMAARDVARTLVGLLAAGMVALRAVRVRDARWAWGSLALGLLIYAAGTVAWLLWIDPLPELPIPSIADALWLSLYPLSYLCIVLLARADRPRASAGVWLDGIIAGLGIGAVCAAVVVQRVFEASSGDLPRVVTTLAYPIADLLLAALVLGVLSIRGWRLNRTWALFGCGFLLLSLSDSILVLAVASGASGPPISVALTSSASALLLAFAAWQPLRRSTPARLEGWSVLAAPAVFTFAALGLLVYDHFDRLDTLGLVLAVLTLLAALGRMALTFRDVRDIAETRRQAVTDDLTSLPNPASS